MNTFQHFSDRVELLRVLPAALLLEAASVSRDDMQIPESASVQPA